MVEEIFSIKLPIGEKQKLMRNRYRPTTGNHSGRISIVAGIHGDELEGHYVAYLLSDWLNANQDKIRGIIDIYPAINSIGIDTINRYFAFDGVDLNRQFPGNKKDILPGKFADGIIDAIRGSDFAIDIHSSNIFIREIPQVRMSRDFADDLVPFAKLLNVDFLWIHDASTVSESTLSHTLNSMGTKTLVVEMGVGMQMTKGHCMDLFEGILNLMSIKGFIDYKHEMKIKTPIYSEYGDVSYVNAVDCGFFVPSIEHCQSVEIGTKIGDIVDPLSGNIKASVTSPSRGILFSLREYPIVYEGSLLARIFGERE